MIVRGAADEGDDDLVGVSSKTGGVGPTPSISTTAVVDRLEKQGHVCRDRDDADRRKVPLRWAEHGMAVAMELFGGLLPLRESVMGPMSDADLGVVRRFLAEMSDAIASHRATLDQAPPTTGHAGESVGPEVRDG